MTRPFSIRQPGPVLEPRVLAEAAWGASIRFTLEPGLLLLESIRRGFAQAGYSSGVVRLRDLALGPFTYVMPALSPDDTHAAFYSAFHRPGGITCMESGAMTFGAREGAPFFHCHGRWREADGRWGGGHVIPEETMVAAPCTVEAYGLAGAGFAARPDLETNFTMFHPQVVAAEAAGTRAFALRLRPNQDIATALEDFCAARGIARARIHGGVGSLIGAHFTDGTQVERFATEVFLEAGEIRPDAEGVPHAVLDIGLVDDTGRLARGRLTRGDNPVLMTFELVLEAS